MAHLGYGRDLQLSGMRTNLQGVVLRRPSGFRQVPELFPELVAGKRYVAVPFVQLVAGEEPAKIHIAGAIAEPSSHLHQRVVHLRCAQEVAYGQSLERKPSRQLVSSDGNDRYAVPFVLVIGQAVSGCSVDGLDFYLLYGPIEQRPDLLPCVASYFVVDAGKNR